MPRRAPSRLAFDALTVEGGLIAPDMIAEIALMAAAAQRDEDYQVPPGLKLGDEINRYWRIALALWARFVEAGKPAVGSRGFVEALLRDVFGFDSLHLAPGISGFQALAGKVPVRVAPTGHGLDKACDAFLLDGRRRSVSLTLQEHLNADERALWGLASDGLSFRLMRDNASLTRPAYIEADLARIFDNALYPDFFALWLLIHQSRFGGADATPADCPLERWREAGQAAGVKARERIRTGVEAALTALGQGFVEHPANEALRAALASGEITPQGLYEELLRLIYRLIFLFTVEDRGQLHTPAATRAGRRLYAEGYSVARLRAVAARRSARDDNHDVWDGLRIVFRGLWRGEAALGLPALGGLFALDQTPRLDEAKIANRHLLDAVFRLAWLVEDRTLVRVNWKDMQTEELGSVYEALLELTPRLDLAARSFAFAAETAGNARKTSGSYYTPDSLVQLLLDSALDPVIERAVAENPGRKAEALLALKVIDPACGSGHFILAAGRRIASRLARIRAAGVPSLEDWRAAQGEVTRSCLYGVDRNPMAVELCRVALWIESVEPGKPLSFLDAHIQCGESLIGVFDLAALAEGIPDDAYMPLTGDDREAAAAWRRANKAEREQAHRLALAGPPPAITEAARAVDAAPEDDLAGVEAKRRSLVALRGGPDWLRLKIACDLYVAAFLTPKREPPQRFGLQVMPTTRVVWDFLAGGNAYAKAGATAVDLCAEAGVFHWPLAFPQVFAGSGFDCVLGNPPWEVLQLGEEEYFAQRAPEIAELAGTARKRAIAALEKGRPEIWSQYQVDLRKAQAGNEFIRACGRFFLTAIGKINTYSLFAELFSRLAGDAGRAGVIVPTGLVTDFTTREFFGSLIQSRRLISSLAFDNQRRIFSGIHADTPFTLLTMGVSDRSDPEFAAYLLSLEHVDDARRRYRLAAADIARINPNTRTAPVFRSREDAGLTARVYERVPVLIDQSKGAAGNPWGVEFSQGLFNMTSDSGLFRTAAQVLASGFAPDGTDWIRGAERFVPLFEGKMIHQLDHRWATYAGTVSREVLVAEKVNPHFEPVPRYWVPQTEVRARLSGWNRWLIGWRRSSNATNERTIIFSLLPIIGVGDSIFLYMSKHRAREQAALFISLNSLVLDYVARQKVGGLNMSFYFMEQFPVLAPNSYDDAAMNFIVPRALELTYTSHAMKPWAEDLGFNGPPFVWNEDRRAVLRAELDAWYARAYGLSRDELRYVLDPADAMGPDYPSETFRVLKKNEIARFGEYRTARLVLDAWDRLHNGEFS